MVTSFIYESTFAQHANTCEDNVNVRVTKPLYVKVLHNSLQHKHQPKWYMYLNLLISRSLEDKVYLMEVNISLTHPLNVRMQYTRES